MQKKLLKIICKVQNSAHQLQGTKMKKKTQKMQLIATVALVQLDHFLVFSATFQYAAKSLAQQCRAILETADSFRKLRIKAWLLFYQPHLISDQLVSEFPQLFLPPLLIIPRPDKLLNLEKQRLAVKKALYQAPNIQILVSLQAFWQLTALIPIPVAAWLNQVRQLNKKKDFLVNVCWRDQKI